MLLLRVVGRCFHAEVEVEVEVGLGSDSVVVEGCSVVESLGGEDLVGSVAESCFGKF